MFRRSAKAGYYASRYKKFGNLCYVIGALQAFFRHHNQDLRIKVSLVYLLELGISRLFAARGVVHFAMHCIVNIH